MYSSTSYLGGVCEFIALTTTSSAAYEMIAESGERIFSALGSLIELPIVVLKTIFGKIFKLCSSRLSGTLLGILSFHHSKPPSASAGF